MLNIIDKLKLRIIFSVFSLVIFSLFFVGKASAATLSVSPNNATVSVGNIISVRVVTNTQGESINNAEATVQFPSDLLEVVSVNNGGFIQADFPVQNSFDNTAGTIDYAIAQPNGTPINGSGTLLEVVFRAKASGNSPIYFQETQAAPTGILLSDSNGSSIKASLANGGASVQ